MLIAFLIVITLIGIVGAIVCVYYATEPKRRRLEEQQREQDARSVELLARQTEIKDKEHGLAEEATRVRALRKELECNVVSYKELQDENAMLKRDLQNLDIHLNKFGLDEKVRRQAQEALDEKINELGRRYLKDNVKWIGSSLNPNNFANCKQRLLDVIERCRGAGYVVSVDDETRLLADLRAEYQMVVRAAIEREEQARIKAQIREEQQRERDLKEKECELERQKREREALESALATELARAMDEHNAEVERLRLELAAKQAEIDATQRAVSNAQLTRSGYVYVISNIGSFGEGVFKVGMTRRDEPRERIVELGDASVPFPFDIHMMIYSNNAPTLENALHQKLHKNRINKTNPRKEFFKADLEAIAQIVKQHHGEVEYVADAEALQYRQSLVMSEEDQEFVEHVYDEVDEDSKAVVEAL